MSPLKAIDNFLDGITMYRLVFYCMIFLLIMAFYLSLYGLLPFRPLDLVFSTAFIFLVCLLINDIFAKIFGAPSNIESVYISAFILTLIISPAKGFGDLPFLIWASILAMASKYILAINKKHIFNPAAFAVALTAFTIGQSASWWVGNIYLLPFVLIVGYLITKKIKRADLVFSFLIISFAAIIIYSLLLKKDIVFAIREIVIYSPIFFFVFVMLTEPATTPPTRNLRIGYGALVGFLFAPFVHLGNIYSTPEIALLAGNIFAYVVSPKQKMVLKLKEKVKIAADTYDFVFTPDQKFNFTPGQYMEWTFGHEKPDNRGIRRYFTIASSPTEDEIRIGVKFYEKPSSYKKHMLSEMSTGKTIVASQLAGDFTMPKNNQEKLAFIAGGIGITPFRSMIKYLLDNDKKRDITIFYSNKNLGDIAYKELFDNAAKKIGIKVVYAITGEKVFIDEQMIAKYAPDFKERIFYISGPKGMVDAFKSVLRKMGVAKNHIKTDFFPGYA